MEYPLILDSILQSLDLTLKSICAALLESDVNVFLVKNLREKVKVRVLPQLIDIAKKGQGDALAGNKGKSLIQKVSKFEEDVDEEVRAHHIFASLFPYLILDCV